MELDYFQVDFAREAAIIYDYINSFTHNHYFKPTIP